MTTLINHLESHLGPIASGWAHAEDGKKLPFQVVCLKKPPIAGVNVLTTLGLSGSLLRVGETSKRLRQELLVMYREVDGERNLPGVLQQIALEALANDSAYSVGQVIGPRGMLRADATVEAFYVTIPVYLPDSFQVFRGSPEGPVVFAWLVPVTAREAGFIRANGASAFEDLLEKWDPDLLDFARPSVV